MLQIELNPQWRIEEITWAPLPYVRPRPAGCNARLGVHGPGGEVPVARVRIGGITGFGWCTLPREQAQQLVGVSARALFDAQGMLRGCFRGLEFPLLDWLGNVSELPVYRIVAAPDALDGGFTVPVYDTSIYFDELDLDDDGEAVERICAEVDFGLRAGHRNFKVKVGRAGMWMDVERGMKRDAAIMLAIRARMGEGGRLMADANNGFNLNLTKRFLSDTRTARLYWMEEAFHEDDQLYTRLKDWMKDESIDTLIADGEGWAAPVIGEWAKKGLVDVLQYDLRGYGFFNWMELAKELSPFGVQAAPHNYGGFYGNYAQTHFAAAADNFAFAEWDQAQAECIDTSAYRIEAGEVLVPALPGFGLKLDDAAFEKRSAAHGWRITL